ncbi:hypothetical protein [Luteibacter aegosomatissinici]|uniref:hypothetical protein n=1 Tax=Luteibacter aegosomatissinici TaxID=2911539 RepID=UPI001FFBE047|nr:hypothetical protein [Luteibacter aegosomatissinici]UPG92690.1 hypothetical protein L2Y97_12520 [Luteibacter aegosomatissinici]
MTHREEEAFVLQTDLEALRGRLDEVADELERALAATFTSEELAELKSSVPATPEGVRDFIKAQRRKVDESLERFATWRGRLPPIAREQLTSMAREGWFLDARMPHALRWRFQERMGAGDVDGATALMRDYFAERASGMLEELSRAYPRRAALLHSAFAAVERGDHGLAIPVLFAQVDGVCFDASTGAAFFVKAGRNALGNHLRRKGAAPFSALAAIYIEAFTADLPVHQNENQRPAGFHGLNRHQVVHGEVVDYGSLENSLRAMSLLYYVAWCTGGLGLAWSPAGGEQS